MKAYNVTPADYCIRHLDGEMLAESEPDTDRHDSQLLYLVPALAVFAVAAIVWAVLR